MKTVVNKTSAPLKVPLPRNKFLRLGPNHSGQIRDDDAERPAVKKMIEAGDVEIVATGERTSVGGRSVAGVTRTGRGGGEPKIGRRSGDR